MTVVLGPGWPGILLHEAIGHGLEGRLQPQGQLGISRGRLGERVASRGVTVVDDGTLPNRRGSLTVDDEGNPTQRTVLIEDGILRGYMQDSLNARLMKMPVTGNGRRESFAHMTLPRMTNTYMLAGTRDPQEIIRSVKKGLYAVNFGGGQVDITTGKFVFSAVEAYMIENGKVSHPVKGATLIGNGPGRADQGQHDRQRPAHRPGAGHLRQGRPERAGRRRPAHAQNRRSDCRWNGLSGFAVFRNAEELAAQIPDGALLALPPDYSLVAMEVVRALIRKKARNLRLLGVPILGLSADPADRRGLRRGGGDERGVARRGGACAALHRGC